MSDENFDKKIRQKLESLEPEYSEASWNRFKKLMPLPWYVTLFRDFGSYIFGGIATMALLGTYFIYKQNQALNDKISILNNQKTEQIKIDTVFVTKTKVDTIFITKYIYSTKYLNKTQQIPSLNSENINTVKPISQNPELYENSAVKTTQKTKNTKSIIEDSNKERSNKQLIGDKPNISDKPGKIKNQNPIVNDDNELNKRDINDKPQINTIISTPSEDYSTAPKKVIVDNSAEDEKVLMNKSDLENAKEKVADDNAGLIIPSKKIIPIIDEKSAKDKKNKEDHSKIQLPNMNAEIGITKFFAHPKSNTFGMIFEYNRKNLGLGTGLIYSKASDEFNLEDDFMKETGKDFEDKYIHNIPPKPLHIQAISITSTTWRIPLFLNYYFPLQKGFSLFATAGTRLDVSFKEKVKYKSEDPNGGHFENQFETKSKPNVFNNLYVGGGVQYKYKRLTGQIAPYYEFSLRQVTDINVPKRYGIMTTLKFSMKK